MLSYHKFSYRPILNFQRSHPLISSCYTQIQKKIGNVFACVQKLMSSQLNPTHEKYRIFLAIDPQFSIPSVHKRLNPIDPEIFSTDAAAVSQSVATTFADWSDEQVRALVTKHRDAGQWANVVTAPAAAHRRQRRVVHLSQTTFLRPPVLKPHLHTTSQT